MPARDMDLMQRSLADYCRLCAISVTDHPEYFAGTWAGSCLLWMSLNEQCLAQAMC